ncbi:DUF6480 family protein [Saccharothrix sp. BKS2]|uniref:DUF6480 family protein n=1 Tax=Saccharothrix lopnurensis TaxID=1670621 RepID=A0ABW1PF02_9PSEU
MTAQPPDPDTSRAPGGALPPDPDPARTPGLEPGGGVAPGDTPPDAGQTSGLSHPQPMPSRRGPIITLVLVVVLTLLVLAFIVAEVMGWSKAF